MKTSGIVRQIDSLGRIVLPIEMRNRLDITPGTGVEIFYENDQIVLKKFQTTCIFCESRENLVDLGGKKVCARCVDRLVKRVID